MPGLNGERTRILYYCPGLEVGGTEKNTHDLAMALPRDRFEPFVIWSCIWGPLGDNLIRAGIPVCRLPLNEARRLPEVVAGIVDIRPDIFHSFSYRQDDRDVRAAKEAGVPTILTSRGNMRFWDPARTLQDWEPFRNDGTDRITVCSEAIAGVVRDVEGVPAEKIRVVYNGVEVPDLQSSTPTIRDELGIPQDVPLIGYVGNYRPEKGHQNLLEAFLHVLRVNPSARLVCCGSGIPGVKPRIDEMAANMGLDQRAFLLDLQLDTGRIYRGLDVYVHPSDTEGFSNSLVEAMAHGLPVVATRTGGNPEAITDGETGLLVPPQDPLALAEAVLNLLGNPALARKLAQSARAKVMESFQFHHMLNGYIQLYEEELAQR